MAASHSLPEVFIAAAAGCQAWRTHAITLAMTVNTCELEAAPGAEVLQT
jgi:hypothetical protein